MPELMHDEIIALIPEGSIPLMYRNIQQRLPKLCFRTSFCNTPPSKTSPH